MGHDSLKQFKAPQYIPQYQKKDQFESKCIQRLKQTPFVGSALYSINPPIYLDPIPEPMVLANLLLPRKQTKQLFPQTQIWKFIRSMITALSDIRDRKYKGHGDICLQNIFYDRNVKNFKLLHPKMVENSAYTLHRKKIRKSYLSPDQLLAFSQKSMGDEISIESDIFVLGVVLCQVCTMLPSQQIYCFQSNSIYDLEILNRLKLIEQYYSPELSSFVGKMLEYDSHERIRIEQLKQLLNKIQSQKKIRQSPKRL